MKKIVLILLATMLGMSLNSCTSQPQIKKERVYIYDGKDFYGDIVPDGLPKTVELVEYNKDGYVTSLKDYDEEGELYCETYNYFDEKGKPLKFTFNFNTEHFKIYKEIYKNDEGKYIQIIDDKTEELPQDFKFGWKKYTIDYDRFDSMIETYNQMSPTDASKLNYIKQITKTDENGNWLECIMKETNKEKLEVYRREILEYWN